MGPGLDWFWRFPPRCLCVGVRSCLSSSGVVPLVFPFPFWLSRVLLWVYPHFHNGCRITLSPDGGPAPWRSARFLSCSLYRLRSASSLPFLASAFLWSAAAGSKLPSLLARAFPLGLLPSGGPVYAPPPIFKRLCLVLVGCVSLSATNGAFALPFFVSCAFALPGRS